MPDRVLKLHDNGADVIEAQGLLNRAGAILEPDGDYGGGTEAAVRDASGSTDGAAVVARSVTLPALQYSIQSRLRRDEVQKRVQSSVLAIKKANAALADALANDRWSLEDVKAAAGAAGELKPAIKELSEQASGLLDRVKILTPFPIMR